ncbi:hypothetical protein [Haliangium ochraceum]|uniref:Roadblock/LC7 family protein n=1 Tax=Haliangium ochraceum (strain DSM 14365 / JCM 11303 / SMP-2) TaxID=502025 RepID=D0LRP1_HALO1|nr:hypothetical protein [Haliangium ochraceum]ACY19033.1 hypothetical protein Hoch_6565 [Haliangium ochraceum DSM 14365]
MSTTESLLNAVPGSMGAARADASGNVVEYTGPIDAETICAVAAMSVHMLDEIGALLGLGGVKGWSIVSDKRALYVQRRPNELMLVESQASKTPESILKKLSQVV